MVTETKKYDKVNNQTASCSNIIRCHFCVGCESWCCQVPYCLPGDIFIYFLCLQYFLFCLVADSGWYTPISSQHFPSDPIKDQSSLDFPLDLDTFIALAKIEKTRREREMQVQGVTAPWHLDPCVHSASCWSGGTHAARLTKTQSRGTTAPPLGGPMQLLLPVESGLPVLREEDVSLLSPQFPSLASSYHRTAPKRTLLRFVPWLIDLHPLKRKELQ